jgi:hypothetical protein
MAATRDALAEIEKQWIKALGRGAVTQLRDTLVAIRSL